MYEAHWLPKLFLSSQKLYLKSMQHIKICKIIFVAPYLIELKLTKKRVIQRGQVFVNKEINVCLVITEANF